MASSHTCCSSYQIPLFVAPISKDEIFTRVLGLVRKIFTSNNKTSSSFVALFYAPTPANPSWATIRITLVLTPLSTKKLFK